MPPPQVDPRQLLLFDIKALSAVTRISVRQLQDMVKEKTFPAPAIRHSRKLVRWTREQVESWIAEKTAPAMVTA